MSAFWNRLVGRPRDVAWTEATFWALDLETSGLDARKDEILAVGMLPIRQGSVRWNERFASLVRPARTDGALGDGLAAHHLLPGEVATGLRTDEALDQVLARLADDVLLVHCAPVDVAFLRAACAACGRPWPSPAVVDTAALLDQMAELEFPKPPPAAGLAAARARFGLPPTSEHDALADALATAELFLVLRHHLRATTLRDLI